MKYSAVHNEFIITQNELSNFSLELRYAMADIRKALDIQLTQRERNIPSQKIDHIEKGLIDACKKIGVDLGAENGFKLDLSEFGS